MNRLEFHGSIMEELRDKLLQRIQTVADSGEKDKYKVLNDLLEKSFPVIKVGDCNSWNKRKLNIKDGYPTETRQRHWWVAVNLHIHFDL